MLVSDLTTKSSARQGIRRPPLAGLKRRRGKGGSWLALGSAVRPQPQPWPPAPESPWRAAQLPRAPPRLPTSRCGQLCSPGARRVPGLRGAFRSARRSRASLPAPALRAPYAAAPQSSHGSPARSWPAGSRRLARLPAWAPGTRSGLAMAVATRGGARILPAPSHLGRPGEAGRQVSAARGGAAPVPAWGRRLGPAPSGTKPSERE